MGFTVEFDCPLFSVRSESDNASPDVYDMIWTRTTRGVSDLLASVAPHAAVILGDDEDDDD